MVMTETIFKEPRLFGKEMKGRRGGREVAGDEVKAEIGRLRVKAAV